jgi:dipeptidyl aminopeptidase/acylaminoacyl peptidase
MKKYLVVLTILFAFLFRLEAQNKLTPELLWSLGRISDFKVSPDGKFILYGITKYDIAENKGNRDLYVIPVTGGEPKKLTDFPGSEFNELWKPDGKKIGFLSAKSGSVQIWEMNTDGSDQKIISNIPDGITGFSYAPNGKNILYTKDVKVDKTPAEIYADLPKANVRIIDNLMYRHWDAWQDYTYSHVFIAPIIDSVLADGYDIFNAADKFDAPVKPFGGMEQICWSTDGSKVAYTSKKEFGKAYSLSTNSDIYIYDLATKTTQNISESNRGYDQDPAFSPDGKMIVWKSMKTPGYESDKDRIMLYDFSTKLMTDLSANFDQSSANFCWSPKSDKLYFISGTKATFQIYSIDIKKKIITQITRGDHDYTGFALAGQAIIGTKMSISMPVEIFSIDEKKGIETQLTFTNKPILDRITMGKVEARWIPTTDGKKMLTWIIYPPNFNPNKKYPALLYCQGGPQSAVSQFFSYRWNFQIMAANDYIIIAPNRRGLPTFGQEWNDQIAGDYGGQNMQDYLTAVDEMAKEPFIDNQRLGAVGASYGGYSVFWLAGNHNKRFKAFIAHCGMYNLESQYAETEEFFFVNHDLGGAPWDNPKPKSYSYSPHLFVDKWDAPIMIISGGYDFRIPYTESMQAFNAAQLRGIPSKFLFFPEESHFVLKPQNSILWQREFFAWLDKYLKK